MFIQITPQKVRHAAGFIVQIANRQIVEYLEEGRSASIEVDFAPITGIFEKTLSGWKTEQGYIPMNESDKKAVTMRIAEGLRAMGEGEVEIC